MATGAGNGWDAWKNAILISLEDQKHCNEETNKKIELLSDKINSYLVAFRVHEREMKVKSGIWGIIGGSIPILIGFGIYIIKELMK